MLDYVKQKNEQNETINYPLNQRLAYLSNFTLCLIVLFLSLALVSCNDNQNNEKIELTIFAASSLTNAFEEIGEQFEENNPTIEIVFNFGSSSQLTAQIIEGVPGDIFASANETQMAILAQNGQLRSPMKVFCTNNLVIGVSHGNPLGITRLSDLTAAGLRLVLAAPRTPIREYSDLVIASSLQSDDQNLLYGNIVSEEANVRQVVTKIALGEADAGIIYSTDLTPDINSLVSAVPISHQKNTTAHYPVAILNGSRSIGAAEDFIQFILSEEGQSILKYWGFGPKP